MRTVHKILGTDSCVDAYLAQCRVRNGLVESSDVHVPPTADEAKELIKYLKNEGIGAVVVGSVAILSHVGDIGDFRPTVDLDLFVPVTSQELQRVPLPDDWKVDLESPGVISWISPSGGYVDFMTKGHQFPSGERSPMQVKAAAHGGDFPIAEPIELFRMKLASMRPKDLTDVLSLARALGHVPTDQEMGPLNQTQRENLDLVRQWIRMRPKGRYGE